MNVERLWNKMWVPKMIGRRGLTTRVISGIDIALWDLRGKITGQPVYRLLGGYRERVPTYIAGWILRGRQGSRRFGARDADQCGDGSHCRQDESWGRVN